MSGDSPLPPPPGTTLWGGWAALVVLPGERTAARLLPSDPAGSAQGRTAAPYIYPAGSGTAIRDAPRGAGRREPGLTAETPLG
ncbi:hypothetical protein GCM10010335_02050 [Streptomyces galbus]|nr:hypothetical protein GCM10010335_02050 [Streptomyces galbus]